MRRFVAVEKAFEGSAAVDRQEWLACDRLSRHTRDNELSAVEAFAVGPEAKDVRWLLAGVLIQRNRFDAAAHVLVCALAEVPNDRQYAMWKWWEANFKDRPDFDDMNWKIAESFLRQFEHGTQAERIAIAETLGKGPREADLNVREFRTSIGLPETQPMQRR